jgi:phage terminase small subunit
MPVLDNQRWELFAQKIAAGESTVRAYELSGFRRSRSNAARLRANESVSARVFELQQASAAGAKITLDGLLDELEHARQRADSLGQLSASVRAISEKARLAGLVVEQQRIEVVNADPYDEATSAEEVLIKVTGDLGIEIALGLAQLFKLPYDEAAIRAMCEANSQREANGQRMIEDWRRPRVRRREL